MVKGDAKSQAVAAKFQMLAKVGKGTRYIWSKWLNNILSIRFEKRLCKWAMAQSSTIR
ncbi:MAG: hypothetical protein ACLTD2_05080 [Ruminococcus sp.]